MLLKNHLIEVFKKASSENNFLLKENIVLKWVHRFGIDSLNELFVKNQDQFKLIEEDQAEVSQNQINLELLKNIQYEEEIEFKPKKTKKSNNTETTDKDIYGSYKNKSEYKDTEELPLPNIKNLRKWINNEKKAS